MRSSRIGKAIAGPLTLGATLVFVSLFLEYAVRIVVDNGMNFDLEMWKYSLKIKRPSADPVLGHEHRPNVVAHLMGVDVATNSQGYRDRDFSEVPAPGVVRIVMLGDSFVEGWGVPVEDTVAKLLERALNRAGNSVEVINTGVGNYNTVMEVQSFLSHSARYPPAIVVLNFTFNDAEPTPSYNTANFLTRYSEATVFIAGTLDSFLRRVGYRQRWDEYYLSLYSLPGWDRAKEAIHTLAAYSREHGILPLMVSWPELHSLRPYPLQRITDSAHQLADAAGVSFVDLLDAVRNESPASLWVTPGDPHPNSRANALYSASLFPVIVRLLDAERTHARAIQLERSN